MKTSLNKEETIHMTSKILSTINFKSESLIDFINTKVQISEEIKAAIQAVSVEEQLPKHQVLIKEGLVAHRLFFINKGSARTFYNHLSLIQV